MKRLFFVLLAVIAIATYGYTTLSHTTHPATATVAAPDNTEPVKALPAEFALYDSLHLADLHLNHEAFTNAVKGYLKLKANGKISGNILSIADFTQPSTQKRLYVIDVLRGKLLFNTLVAHGRNSGGLMANSFSNKNSSNQSSLGFYATGETYTGKHGTSLRLDGLEPGINCNARERAVVLHAADYVSAEYAKNLGYIGRSFGCPAVPNNLCMPIINTIKNKNCLFIYSEKTNYLHTSGLLS